MAQPCPETTPRQIADMFCAMVEVLAMLPNDSDEIAATLKDAGTVGVRGEGKLCGLACYITDACKLPDDVELMVDGTGAFIEKGDLSLGLMFPAHLEQFVKRFDAGDYPDITVSSGVDDDTEE